VPDHAGAWGVDIPGWNASSTKSGRYPELLMEPNDNFEPPIREDWLAPLIQAWAICQQAVGLYDDQDRLRYANPIYRDIFLDGQDGSFTLSELLRYGFEQRIGTVIECGDIDVFIADLYTRRRKVGAHQAFETDLMDGRWFFMNQTVLPNGWILTVGTDITTLKDNEKTLRQAAQTDPLTGLANRRQMFSLLDSALAGMATDAFCLALIDIDRFKGINDRFGHPTGDAVYAGPAGHGDRRGRSAASWTPGGHPAPVAGERPVEHFLHR
jgi:hypothetical protein